MARNRDKGNTNMPNDETPAEETTTETAPTPAAEAAPAAAPAPVEEARTDERFKLVKHPETGEMVKRKDFIIDQWTKAKKSRGDIAKLLTQITGKKVAYQIVFAATKNVPGGPDKAPAEPAPAAAEAVTSPAESSPAE